ncbi:SDR family oxidoreductase [Nocardia asteroides]|uniref:SDR family oxidoreductase n=1 Tax=Nocardia asteroides TaxID=1824 RepID=UPI001E3D680E|nr:NAD-dependent epimerase/dehydratase family protein [Nocardia asteroides]UGT62227.1 NAD-dependent epimerase/dehydratase family protein [Nocardia asteroides]
MRVAVLGAGGLIGAAVAEVLTGRGHEVIALTRTSGVDAYTGAGLDAALVGVDAIVDAVNSPLQETEAVREFFGTVARRVRAAAARTGVRHIVLLSIIGIDDTTAGHYAGKLAQEHAYLEGAVPVRILRAAQFHEFTEMMLNWTTVGDTATVPRMRTQLVSARTVAERLADLALAAEAPARLELAGPEPLELVTAVRALAERRGAPAHVLESADDTAPDAALQADGGLLPGPAAELAGPTFASWLDRRHPAG